MASEQIEYCGCCEHYEQCRASAKAGNLKRCIAAEKEGKSC